MGKQVRARAAAEPDAGALHEVLLLLLVLLAGSWLLQPAVPRAKVFFAENCHSMLLSAASCSVLPVTTMDGVVPRALRSRRQV